MVSNEIIQYIGGCNLSVQFIFVILRYIGVILSEAKDLWLSRLHA